MTVFKKVIAAAIFIPIFILAMLFGLIILVNMSLASVTY